MTKKEYLSPPQCYRLNEALPLHRELCDALAETIERVTNKCSVPLFLTGGVSASLLSRDSWPAEQRLLSRDLDFLVPGDAKSRAVLEGEYDGKFHLNAGKAIFKSDKLMSHSACNGVELDFIASSNIVHDDTSISVTVTPSVYQHAGREQFLGVEVFTLPPELVTIQKLYAGRGVDLHKFDLLDSEAIIRSGRVDPALLRAFFLELTKDDNHRRTVAAHLISALRRLPSDLDIHPLVAAFTDIPSAEELQNIQRHVRDGVSNIH